MVFFDGLISFCFLLNIFRVFVVLVKYFDLSGVKGVEKLISSKMMLAGSNRRIHSVHRHSGMVNSCESFTFSLFLLGACFFTCSCYRLVFSFSVRSCIFVNLLVFLYYYLRTGLPVNEQMSCNGDKFDQQF